ncbi:DUF4157 domain-containing protein [Natronolimnobius sp. AArcel1]|uniref:eCIS core domain-containing protein n=1 Tax=Natronolimnobius sp. AArcel1 TaxID=1679093 RepID=UPI0013EB4AF6|nr:DUF4157 domain-containing protein [Natronolimnobius sp. AArcel1]NGM69776.1 DUF4157 domain-containing protein [Natronolimnobius sp. AArcel1]
MGSKKSRKRKTESSEQANASTSSQHSTQEKSHSSGATMGSHGLGMAAESAVHGTNPNRVSDPTPSYEFGHPGLAPSPSEHNIQRALAGTGTSQDEVPDTVLDVLGDGGQSLDQPIQRALEERMDADFSNVRIHTGAKAAEAANAIDAKAFTCGNDIVFNSGEYDPESGEGQFLLAHELAHVKQQTGAAISMMPQEGADVEIDPDPQLEREADETATQALSGDKPVVVNRLGTDIHIQRKQMTLEMEEADPGKLPDEPLSNEELADRVQALEDELTNEEIRNQIQQIEAIKQQLKGLETADCSPEEFEKRIERLEEINVDQIELAQKGDMGGSRDPDEITQAGVKGAVAKGGVTLAGMIVGGGASTQVGMDPSHGAMAGAVAASTLSDSIRASWDWMLDHAPGADTWEVDELLEQLQQQQELLESDLADTSSEDPTGVREEEQ